LEELGESINQLIWYIAKRK